MKNFNIVTTVKLLGLFLISYMLFSASSCNEHEQCVSSDPMAEGSWVKLKTEETPSFISQNRRYKLHHVKATRWQSDEITHYTFFYKADGKHGAFSTYDCHGNRFDYTWFNYGIPQSDYSNDAHGHAIFDISEYILAGANPTPDYWSF